MAEEFKPSTPHTINPLDAKHPFLFQNDLHTSHIQSLTIYTTGESGAFRNDLAEFFNHLHSLTMLVIHWKALDWVQLKEHELQPFIQLLSLPSLQELQILASANFPLCLLRYYRGEKLRIEATTLATAIMPLYPADNQTRQGALTELELVGAQNIREFRTFLEWQPENAQVSLQHVKRLRFSTSWRNSNSLPKQVLKEIGSLLLPFGILARGLEEVRILDWQSEPFDGHQFSPADLASLTSLKRVHAHLASSPKSGTKTMDAVDSSIRTWLLPFLSNLPSPHLLEQIDVNFSFIVPFPWPKDLQTWIQNFAAFIDDMWNSKFPSLRTANFTFDLRGAGTFNWRTFSASLRPVRLLARGVTSEFRVSHYP